MHTCQHHDLNHSHLTSPEIQQSAINAHCQSQAVYVYSVPGMPTCGEQPQTPKVVWTLCQIYDAVMAGLPSLLLGVPAGSRRRYHCQNQSE